MKHSILRSVAVLLAISLSSLAYAEEQTPAQQQSQASFGEILRKKAKLSYQGWLYGMRSDQLDGVKGEGTDLALDHYISAGYRITPKASINVTEYFTQKFKSENQQAKGGEDLFTTGDVYLTLSHASLLSSEKYGTNLYGYIRYYAPTSYGTKIRTGTAKDQGNGATRLLLTPSKTFLDGAMTVKMDSMYGYKFARNAPEVREDSYFRFIPGVSYQLSSKVEASLEYDTGYLVHKTNGTYSQFGDSQSIAPGIIWSPVKQLSLNPYVSWGPKFLLSQTDIGFVATYTFL